MHRELRWQGYQPTHSLEEQISTENHSEISFSGAESPGAVNQALKEKKEATCKNQMSSENREMEMLRKKQREMLENESVREMSILDGSQLTRQSQGKNQLANDMSIETS